MKQSVILLLICCCYMLNAQEVEQQKSSMSLGSQNAYYVEVEGATKEMLEDVWKEYVKEYGKSKKNSKAKEFVSDKVKVPIINGSSPVTLYCRHEEGKGIATTYLWVDLGGSFASGGENRTQSDGIETFMKDYWVIARKKAISKELEMEEKKLNGLSKDLSKLEGKNKDYHNEIDKCKLKIIEAEKNIETNLKDQETKKTEIESQKKAVKLVIERINAVSKSL